jgi:hypothetical protein
MEVRKETLSVQGCSSWTPKGVNSCSSTQEPSATAERSLFSPLPPAFAMVPQYLFHPQYIGGFLGLQNREYLAKSETQFSKKFIVDMVDKPKPPESWGHVP